ncbi:LysR substrate-binding domain-containing protein [Rhizobium sp. A37_96]
MNLASVDLNLLVAFEAMMEERHVTRAADRIGLAQSSMSNVLKRLRDLFDDELFLRAGGRMQPTDKAMALARPIASALRQIRNALSPEATFDAAFSQRRFTIAVTDYGDLIVMPKLVHLLRREAPGVDLVVRPITDGKSAVTRLERGDVDILIGGHLPDSSLCVREKLFDERFICISDRSNAEASRLTLEDYASLPHAMFSAVGGDSIPGVVDTLLSQRGLKRRIAVTLPHIVAIPFAVAGTDLIATMAERVACLFVDNAGISIHRPPFEIQNFAIDIVHARRSSEDGGMRWLIDTVKRAAHVAPLLAASDEATNQISESFGVIG